MKWKPISEAEIWEKINASYERMNWEQIRLWEVVKVYPHKWMQKPYGELGGGFWVVAIYGENIIWFNDIEDGFNISKYAKFGEFEDYWCNQSNLESAIQNVLNEIRDGHASNFQAGPPINIQ